MWHSHNGEKMICQQIVRLEDAETLLLTIKCKYICQDNELNKNVIDIGETLQKILQRLFYTKAGM